MYNSFLKAVGTVPSQNKIMQNHRNIRDVYPSVWEVVRSDLDIQCSGHMGNGGKRPCGAFHFIPREN